MQIAFVKTKVFTLVSRKPRREKYIGEIYSARRKSRRRTTPNQPTTAAYRSAKSWGELIART